MFGKHIDIDIGRPPDATLLSTWSTCVIQIFLDFCSEYALGVVVVNIDSQNNKSPPDVHEVMEVPLGFLFSTSSLRSYVRESTI